MAQRVLQQRLHAGLQPETLLPAGVLPRFDTWSEKEFGICSTDIGKNFAGPMHCSLDAVSA